MKYIGMSQENWDEVNSMLSRIAAAVDFDIEGTVCELAEAVETAVSANKLVAGACYTRWKEWFTDTMPILKPGSMSKWGYSITDFAEDIKQCKVDRDTLQAEVDNLNDELAAERDLNSKLNERITSLVRSFYTGNTKERAESSRAETISAIREILDPEHTHKLFSLRAIAVERMNQIARANNKIKSIRETVND